MRILIIFKTFYLSLACYAARSGCCAYGVSREIAQKRMSQLETNVLGSTSDVLIGKN